MASFHIFKFLKVVNSDNNILFDTKFSIEDFAFVDLNLEKGATRIRNVLGQKSASILEIVNYLKIDFLICHFYRKCDQNEWHRIY